MNTPILRMSRLVGALFAILLISATIIQFVQAPSLLSLIHISEPTRPY